MDENELAKSESRKPKDIGFTYKIDDVFIMLSVFRFFYEFCLKLQVLHVSYLKEISTHI